jgi:putative membrane protein
MMLEIFVYIFSGVLVGIGAAFVPGLFYSEISLLLFGFLTDITAAVFIASSAISFSLFEFISTNIFEIGDDITSLSLDNLQENLEKIAKTVSFGAIVSLLLSIPVFFVFQNMFSQISSIVRNSLLVILAAIILYTIFSEKTLSRKILAAFIFALTGIFGTLIQNSGFLPSNLMLMPVFMGLYGFSSILARKHTEISGKHSEKTMTCSPTIKEKIRISLISFGSTLFSIFIPSMKRSQTSAIAFGIGKFEQSETVLLSLSIISTSFLVISIIALSTNSVRSTLAYDISDMVGQLNYNQILLILGSLVIAAVISIFLLLNSVKFLNRIVSRINKKYLKTFGLVCGSILILYFTSWKWALLAVVATSIGILSIKLKVRSVHLMGVLLVPTLIRLAGI